MYSSLLFGSSLMNSCFSEQYCRSRNGNFHYISSNSSMCWEKPIARFGMVNTFVGLFLIYYLSVRTNKFRSRLTGNDTYRNLTEGSVRSIIAAPGDPVSKLVWQWEEIIADLSCDTSASGYGPAMYWSNYKHIRLCLSGVYWYRGYRGRTEWLIYVFAYRLGVEAAIVTSNTCWNTLSWPATRTLYSWTHGDLLSIRPFVSSERCAP